MDEDVEGVGDRIVFLQLFVDEEEGGEGVVAQGRIRRGGWRQRETCLVGAGDGGWGESAESDAPAFEEEDLDGSLVLPGVVDGAGGGGAVPEAGVEGFIVAGDFGGARGGLEEGVEELARERDVVGAWLGGWVISRWVCGYAR